MTVTVTVTVTATATATRLATKTDTICWTEDLRGLETRMSFRSLRWQLVQMKTDYCMVQNPIQNPGTDMLNEDDRTILIKPKVNFKRIMNWISSLFWGDIREMINQRWRRFHHFTAETGQSQYPGRSLHRQSMIRRGRRLSSHGLSLVISAANDRIHLRQTCQLPTEMSVRMNGWTTGGQVRWNPARRVEWKVRVDA